MPIVDKSFNEIKEGCNLTLSSILAGVCISIGCIVNLIVGGGPLGAILFTFGLITVVHYKYALFTGTAGFIELNKIKEYKKIILILLGNILGCILLSIIVYNSYNINSLDAPSSPWER